MWSAIDFRMTLSFTSSSRAPSSLAGADGGAGAAERAGAAGAAGAASTSSRVTRPPRPLPWMDVGSMPRSAASLRTAGDRRACSSPPGARWAGAAVGAGAAAGAAAGAGAALGVAGAGAGAAAAAPVSIWAITAPTRTTWPSPASILTSVPSNGDGISALTLSVTTSTIGSSRFTNSPSRFSHFSTVPSVTEPPLVLVGLEHESLTRAAVVETRQFNVSVLTRAQEFLAERFAGRAPAVDPRWKDVPHHLGANGIPLIDDCAAWLECDVTQVHS